MTQNPDLSKTKSSLLRKIHFLDYHQMKMMMKMTMRIMRMRRNTEKTIVTRALKLTVYWSESSIPTVCAHGEIQRIQLRVHLRRKHHTVEAEVDSALSGLWANEEVLSAGKWPLLTGETGGERLKVITLVDGRELQTGLKAGFGPKVLAMVKTAPEVLVKLAGLAAVAGKAVLEAKAGVVAPEVKAEVVVPGVMATVVVLTVGREIVGVALHTQEE